MIKHILPLIPKHKVYVEAFCGGASVFFAKPLVEINVINDRMDVLVNMYRQARLHPEEFIKQTAALMYSKQEYIRSKEVLKSSVATDMEKAVAFWYQCNSSFLAKPFAGFGRLTKLSNNGRYGVIPYRQYADSIGQKLDMLKHVQVDSVDAVDCIKDYDSVDTFFYLDPPYIGTTMGPYKGYMESEFLNLLEALSNIKGKFLLSTFASEMLSAHVNQYGWQQKLVSQDSGAKNGMNGVGGKKIEVLTYNYNPNETVSEMVWR